LRSWGFIWSSLTHELHALSAGGNFLFFLAMIFSYSKGL
jgi:hypothetical protein